MRRVARAGHGCTQSGLVQDMLDPDGHGETGPDLRQT